MTQKTLTMKENIFNAQLIRSKFTSSLHAVIKLSLSALNQRRYIAAQPQPNGNYSSPYGNLNPRCFLNQSNNYRKALNCPNLTTGDRTEVQIRIFLLVFISAQ